MIEVTRLNRQDRFWVNENLIEFMEETPDTILTMTTGRKVVVAESAVQVAEMANRNRPMSPGAIGATRPIEIEK